jgi:hypothetical protein
MNYDRFYTFIACQVTVYWLFYFCLWSINYFSSQEFLIIAHIVLLLSKPQKDTIYSKLETPEVGL